MTDYDVLVVGAGIGGMESALKLGDMGYRVLLVEKEASVGGKMILLSKVFPTLDCASCISTPKMAATIHHPNVTTLTYSEVEGIEPRRRRPLPREDQAEGPVRRRGGLHRLPAVRDGLHRRRPRPVQRRPGRPPRGVHRLPAGGARRRRSSSGPAPRPARTPARPGIKAHGYVSLIRSGEYEKAFQLVLDATPLVGTLGRACYAPCEVECTRGSLEGPLPIRRLKRFVADIALRAVDGPGVDGPRAERPPGRHRRLRAGRPDRRLAARPQGLRGQDLRGGARGRRLPAPGHPGLPPARPRSSSRTSPTSPRSASRSPRTRRSRTSRRSTARATTPSWWRPARRSRPGSASPARSSTASSAASTSCARSSSARAST